MSFDLCFCRHCTLHNMKVICAPQFYLWCHFKNNGRKFVGRNPCSLVQLITAIADSIFIFLSSVTFQKEVCTIHCLLGNKYFFWSEVLVAKERDVTQGQQSELKHLVFSGKTFVFSECLFNCLIG